MKRLESYRRVPQVIVSIAGEPKTGKTFFGFTLPGPHYYHQFDPAGLNRVIEHLPQATVEALSYEDYSIALVPDINAALGLLQRFRKEFRLSVLEAAKTGGTVIVDTESLLWDLIQNALVPNDTDARRRGQLRYAEANSEYRGIFGYVRDPAHSCSVVLIHQMKDEWETVEEDGKRKSAATGNRIPNSHKECWGFIDVRLLTLKPYPGAGRVDFRLKIDTCGLDPKLEGLVIDPSGRTPGSLQLPATYATILELLGG